jgi:hypothetical protein
MSAGGSPEVLAGLLQGKFQAGILTPPTSTTATKMGYREIFDLASLEFPFPVISVVSTRKYIDGKAAAVLESLKTAAAGSDYSYLSRGCVATNSLVVALLNFRSSDLDLIFSVVSFQRAPLSRRTREIECLP